ncbi:MAG TPA: SCE4755 family polysaccharide monooxygenase-like protein [Polyangiales bacterium]|nr:SCE4755 family polysaccharide monooxygenase-like protein [Polyangiales bacterium]
MEPKAWMGSVLAGAVLLCSTHADAHFKLRKPASWLNEDELGGPQKGSPCGPGNAMLIIGDDKQPVPTSGAVTSFRAGEKIAVELDETVYHPGYYRISIAKTRASKATSTDFPIPALTDSQQCYYDKSAVKTAPHDAVLGDGLFMASEISAPGRTLKHEITLPNEPCEECTLQVVQVMEGHGGSSCFYFHCADIRITAAEGGSAGGAAPSEPSSSGESDDGGCSVAQVGSRSARGAWWAIAPLAAFALRRRRRAHTARGT